MINIVWFLVGFLFGMVFLIIISVMSVSGKQSDEEYRRELEQMKKESGDDE